MEQTTKNRGLRRAGTLLLALALVLSLSLTCALPALAAEESATIALKIRVYDQLTGKAYEVGSDTAVKGTQGIQSQPYTLRPLTDFTKGTYTRLVKVVGNWYFPVSDRQPGSIVYFSNNSSTATVTYWVEGYTPSTVEQPKPGTPDEPSVTPPSVEDGEVSLTVKVVYVNYNDQIVGFGDAQALKLKCQSSYCSHNINCSINLKDFHPKTLGIGESITQNNLTYKWIGWSKYNFSAAPQFGTFYDWKSGTTNVTTPKSSTFYLIYKNSDAPASNDTILADGTGLAVNGDGIWNYLDAMMIMDYLAGTVQLSEAQLREADVNGDGVVNYLDAMTIMDRLAGTL